VADHVVTPPSRAGAREVPRELDWVVMRCLEKDPERRYPTADALAADLERYLDGRAIEAGPPDRVYRAVAWLKRHQALALGVAAVLVTLIAGVSVSTVLALRERDARQSAEQVADFLNSIFAGLDPVVAQGRDRTLLTLAIDQAGASLKNAAMTPEVEARLSGVLAGSYFVVGEFAKSYPLAQRSFDLTRRLYGPDDPRAIEALRLLIEVRNSSVDPDPMTWLMPATRELEERASRVLPRGSRARIKTLLVALLWSKAYEQAVSAFDAMIAEAEESLGKTDRLTLTVLRRAAKHRTADPKWALEAIREARRRAIEAYGPDDPETELGLATESWAAALVQGNAAAITLLRERLPHATEVLGPLAQPVFVGRYNLGSMLVDQGAYAEAEPLLLQVHDMMLRKHGTMTVWANWVDAALLRIYLRTGRMAEAEAIDRRMWAARPNGPDLSDEIWIELARAWVAAGRPQRAAEYSEHLRRTWLEVAQKLDAALRADSEARSQPPR
jgi:tetratricopeptide (TPR) repeat protein